MKTGVFAGLALVALSAGASVTTSKPEDVAKLIPQETEEARAARMAWWTHDRFGMFIHFGLYALPARHEWVRNYEKITNKDYEKYFERFDPEFLHDASELKIVASPGELAQEKDAGSGFNGFLELPVVKPDVEMPVVELYLKD